MIKITITVDNPLFQNLMSLSKKIGSNIGLVSTENALEDGAKMVADGWRGYAAKKESLPGVPDMKRASNDYMKGVYIKKVSPFSYEVSNVSPVASFLEYGTKGFDMKKTHPYGKKSRVSKEGVPYLIVPFSWGTAGTVTSFSNIMTKKVNTIAERLTKSSRKKETRIDENFSGEAIERDTYEWKGRFSKTDADNVGNSYASGMVRMKDSASRGSTYLTFRIISAHSPKNSWVNKGIPARYVTEGLKNKYMKDVEDMIMQGIEDDLM